MDTGKLDMFGDGVLDHFAIHGYRVEFYLFRPLQEFGNNYRIFLGNLGCQVQEFDHLLLTVAYVHGCAGKHVRRTDQDWETDLCDKGVDLFHAGQLGPTWLVDT